MLVGDLQEEFSSAARFLARRVHHLVLVCPVEHFRNRLAWQILTECGLAVMTKAEIPADGWEIAVDIRRSPPTFIVGRQNLRPSPRFPDPLQSPSGLPSPESMHPVWAECHLACLPAPGEPPLPDEASLRAVQATLALSERAGLTFTLA